MKLFLYTIIDSYLFLYKVTIIHLENLPARHKSSKKWGNCFRALFTFCYTTKRRQHSLYGPTGEGFSS